MSATGMPRRAKPERDEGNANMVGKNMLINLQKFVLLLGKHLQASKQKQKNAYIGSTRERETDIAELKHAY